MSIILLYLCLFTALFIREIHRDIRERQRREREANAHIMNEVQKFCEQKGITFNS